MYWKCPDCGTGNILQDVKWCPGCYRPRAETAESEQHDGLPETGEADELALKEEPNAKS